MPDTPAYLLGQQRKRKRLPFCEHYAGLPRYIFSALKHQERAPYPFDVTIDLEDGAPVGQEQAHLDEVISLLQDQPPNDRRLGVRIHPMDSSLWSQELELLIRHCGSRLSYITLPKATCAGQVRDLINRIEQLCRQYQLAAHLPVHVLLENQQGIRDAWTIAAEPGVETLDFGLIDLVADYAGAIPAAAMEHPLQFQHGLICRARTEIAAAAHHYSLTPAHAVTLELTREAALRDARIARDLFGYNRMYSIHSLQIDGIIEAMSPSAAELQVATEVLERARAANWGPIAWQGKLHDAASYRYYLSVLDNARYAGKALPAQLDDLLPSEPV
ncbi:MAG: HpcH/HpaI aldolase/citrate lyase family protein [Pseudomonas sp.]